MKVKYAVYSTSGEVHIIQFEKPQGAHPDSPNAYKVAYTIVGFLGIEKISRLSSGYRIKTPTISEFVTRMRDGLLKTKQKLDDIPCDVEMSSMTPKELLDLLGQEQYSGV